MFSCSLDHLVVAAESLAQGAAYIESELGVRMQPGGKHALMGTHNLLLRIGESAYLEVIAIDPDAPVPSRPRWFALDDPSMQSALAAQPRLIHWVAQTNNLDAALRACPLALGVPTDLSRGDLRWTFALSDDGSMPLDGMAPDLIQWRAGGHPSQRLLDAGCELRSMQAQHPNSALLSETLQALGLADVVSVRIGDAPALRACINTPGGERWLGR
jgi:hypothetical protein